VDSLSIFDRFGNAFNVVENSPWSNDEIQVRLNMCRDSLDRMGMNDDFNRIALQREMATWEELLRRRKA